MIAPAMNTRMWDHPAVQANLRTLVDRGVHVIQPEVGHVGELGRQLLADRQSVAVENLGLFRPGCGLQQEPQIIAGLSKLFAEIGIHSADHVGGQGETEALGRGWVFPGEIAARIALDGRTLVHFPKISIHFLGRACAPRLWCSYDDVRLRGRTLCRHEGRYVVVQRQGNEWAIPWMLHRT